MEVKGSHSRNPLILKFLLVVVFGVELDLADTEHLPFILEFFEPKLLS